MIEGFPRVLIILGALASALVAGIFLAFSNFIMKALERMAPPGGISAMQSINVTVINPLFMTLLFGTAIVCIYLIINALSNWQQSGSSLLLLGGLLYLIGTILVTILFSVPRNDVLAALDSSSAQRVPVWSNYVTSWTFWNHVRTISAIGAALSFVLALKK
ncbi:MAG TPA: anthrone oxygenase family protein [candidate division Zixibacteria bacterium]|nr:anthrone oxygenase family protein [candidate division Zixibacteria bacterium]